MTPASDMPEEDDEREEVRDKANAKIENSDRGVSNGAGLGCTGSERFHVLEKVNRPPMQNEKRKHGNKL